MPRGEHTGHVRGSLHYRWRGGNPKPDPVKRRANADASAARYPERHLARQQVAQEIRMGRMPRATDRVCLDCGAQAAQYDHPRGYDEGHALDVEPVCMTCHGARSRERGEHKGKRGYRPKANGRELDGRTWDEYPAAGS